MGDTHRSIALVLMRSVSYSYTELLQGACPILYGSASSVDLFCLLRFAVITPWHCEQPFGGF